MKLEDTAPTTMTETDVVGDWQEIDVTEYKSRWLAAKANPGTKWLATGGTPPGDPEYTEWIYWNPSSDVLIRRVWWLGWRHKLEDGTVGWGNFKHFKKPKAKAKVGEMP